MDDEFEIVPTSEGTSTALAERPAWYDEKQVKELMDALQLDMPQKAAFLLAYAETGHVATASRAIGLSRQTHYNWLDYDARYAAAFPVAHRWLTDNLEGEIRRRAMLGDERGVYYKGEKIDTYYQKSDLLLIFSAKGEMPEKYRDNVHITGEVVQVREYRGFSVDDV